MNQDKFGKLTKSQFKSIKSLKQKKYRDQSATFLIEGRKLIEEALSSGAPIELIIYRDESEVHSELPVLKASSKEMEMLSNMKSPPNEAAVCRYFEKPKIDYSKPILALDGVSDPGNLGTIIRLCDWFSIPQIVANPGTVDIYNPKVVQASMGSIFRTNFIYQNLDQFLDQAPAEIASYAADMDGESMYDIELEQPFILIMGSESHGVNSDLISKTKRTISIPRYGKAESLNVATATAILLSQFKR